MNRFWMMSNVRFEYTVLFQSKPKLPADGGCSLHEAVIQITPLRTCDDLAPLRRYFPYALFVRLAR